MVSVRVQTHQSQCLVQDDIFRGVDCNIFENQKPSSLALSTLVIIEMLNACNRWDCAWACVDNVQEATVYCASKLDTAQHYVPIYISHILVYTLCTLVHICILTLSHPQDKMKLVFNCIIQKYLQNDAQEKTPLPAAF